VVSSFHSAIATFSHLSEGCRSSWRSCQT
jgi:hypothetical protein